MSNLSMFYTKPLPYRWPDGWGRMTASQTLQWLPADQGM